MNFRRMSDGAIMAKQTKAISKNLNDNESYELLSNLTFCVFDLETTGGNHDNDKIIEIGLVKIKNLEIVDEQQFLINPEIDIPGFIQKLTSIHPKDLVDSPTVEEVIDEVIEFMGDSVLVAHNTSFDVPFLNSVLEKLGKPQLKNRVVCTNLMTKFLIPGIMNSNLAYMSMMFGIKHNHVHRAIGDARATACLLINYLHFFIEKKIKKVNQIYYPKNKFELDRSHFIKEEHKTSTICKTIEEIKSPLIIMLKGDQGLLLTTIPINSPSKELPFIKKCLKETPWTSMTIRLLGSFFEALLFFNQHFTKSQKEYVEPVLSYLSKIHLKDKDEAVVDFFEEYDFIFGKHIVREQFTSYSLLNFSVRNQLIFRFPTHKKKLSQFINMNIKKHSKNKAAKKNNIQKELMLLINSFLTTELQNKSKHYLFLKLEDIIASNRDFNKKIETYTKRSPRNINYPKEHI